jgi:succinate-acetate transporter protein
MEGFNMNTGMRAPTIDGDQGRTAGSDAHLTSLWTKAGMVETDRPLSNFRGLEAEHQAIIGDPAPMALFGFAVGTFLLAMIAIGFWPAATAIAIVPALLWFAGVGQFVGGLLALARGSTFGATAFCSFGMVDIIVGTYTWMQHGGIMPSTGNASTMLGIALFCFAYIALMLTIAAARANVAYLATIAALVPGYALVAVAYVGGAAVVGQIGGWFLCAAAILAFYAAGAVVVNSQWCREVLPLGKLRR